MLSSCSLFVTSDEEKNHVTVDQGQVNLDAPGNGTVDEEFGQREINASPSQTIW